MSLRYAVVWDMAGIELVRETGILALLSCTAKGSLYACLTGIQPGGLGCACQVGIYKTDNATKSVTITPAAFAVRPAADALPSAQLVAAQ